MWGGWEGRGKGGGGGMEEGVGGGGKGAGIGNWIMTGAEGGTPWTWHTEHVRSKTKLTLLDTALEQEGRQAGKGRGLMVAGRMGGEGGGGGLMKARRG